MEVNDGNAPSASDLHSHYGMHLGASPTDYDHTKRHGILYSPCPSVGYPSAATQCPSAIAADREHAMMTPIKQACATIRMAFITNLDMRFCSYVMQEHDRGGSQNRPTTDQSRHPPSFGPSAGVATREQY